MKKLILLLIICTLSFAFPAYAKENQDSHSVEVEQTIDTGDVHVSVNGLVCDFCARALEKVFGKEEAVKDIDVNLDTKIITINFNEGRSLSDEQLTELITDSGYNVEEIHRVR